VIAGQLAAILLLHFIMECGCRVFYAVGAVAASALSNVIITTTQPFSRRLTDGQAALFLIYDTLQLAVLLYLTGGVQNPFALLFLAPVTVSATILSLRSTILILILVLASAAVLAVFHFPLPWPEPGIDLPQLYLFGLWVGVSMGVFFVAVYVSRITAEARRCREILGAMSRRPGSGTGAKADQRGLADPSRRTPGYTHRHFDRDRKHRQRSGGG
jgi:two-component system sensor histidine kinase RegB